MKWLLLFISVNALAADELTPTELELLKKAAVTAQVEPWDPKRLYPDIINDVPGYVEPPARYYPVNPNHMLYIVKDRGTKNAKTR